MKLSLITERGRRGRHHIGVAEVALVADLQTLFDRVESLSTLILLNIQPYSAWT